MRGTRRTGDLIAPCALAWSARKARSHQVSECEATVFRWFNEAPDELEVPAWIVMQAGSLAAVFVVAGVTYRRRGPTEALEVLGVGTTVWAGVKAVKPAIGRGRPAQHLDDVKVRGRSQSGLGFPSGHAAVSMTLAVVATSSGRWRAPALAVAVLAGCSRMFVGAHLPLDVVGGFAAGVIAGRCVERLRPLWAGS